MSNLPHRAPSRFTVGQSEDEKIQAMLTLYQSPATIRDMKQVFFYTGVDANVTQLHYWQIFYNKTVALGTDAFDIYSKQIYYAPLGTTRQLDITSKINDLLDVRVPKDKYFFEINLIECTIEADPSAWTSIPDRVFRNTGLPNPNAVELETTYTWGGSLADKTGPAPEPPRAELDSKLIEASKLTEPQTLYCRIRECSNSEPYNWAVTSSGQFSVDKSHQVVIRHGDIDVSNLTLEFGHGVFAGVDTDYNRFITDPSRQNAQYIQSSVTVPAFIPNIPRNRSDNFRYFDYNQEYFNQIDTPLAPAGDFPRFYKGDYQFPNTGLTFADYNDNVTANNITQLSNRPPFYRQALGTGVDTPYNLQGKPFFFNQCVHKINFRFMVKLIHLF